MYCLSVIRKINAEAATKPRHETETTRHCSFHKQTRGANKGCIVLHSAKLRSTGWLEREQARRFEAEYYSTNSITKRDQIIESWFRVQPTGKRRIAVS